MYSRCPDVIFQTLPSSSRLMTSHHVTGHVTSLSRAFFIVLLKKNKSKSKSKIRKIKEKENKIVNVQLSHNNTGHLTSRCSLPKPNKMAYNSLKMFYPIILLNTLEKFIEKVICKKLQYQLISMNFIHPSQLGGLKQ